MPFFDDKFIEELKSKLNIVDVIGKYCVLQRKGSQYWARCPLPGHSEKTPSFSVNEHGQFYHCFGCGKGGDVIKFVQEVEHLDFNEAITNLAEVAKIPLPVTSDYDEKTAKQNKDKKDRLYALLKDTAHYYVNNLNDPKAKPIKDYMQKRGISKEIARTFGLGASIGYDNLPQFLKGKGYSEEEMIMAGVCQKSENGKIFDAEANRLIVPIIDSLNRVIAFGGRVILKPKDNIGKYKNTQETVIFSKKRTLFAINNLKRLTKAAPLKNVIMVEGYMDTIALYQAGFQNVVASMGTSLTVEQAKLLKRYTDTVIVSYDGDSAGQKATVRSLDIFADAGLEVKVLHLPDGKDPDDLIRTEGATAYNNLILNAEPLIDFKLRLISYGKNLNDVFDKRKYVTESLKLISEVKDAYLREELLKKVRDASDITYESLKRDLEKGIVDAEPGAPINNSLTFSSTELTKAEKFILCSYIFKKPYAQEFDITSIVFGSQTAEKIVDYICENNDEISPQIMLKVVGEENIASLDEILCAGDKIFDTPIESKYFSDCVISVKRLNIENDIKRLNQAYKEQTDIEKRKQIAQLIVKKSMELL